MIITFLFRPPTDEHEEVGVGVLFNACPFLRLSLMFRSLSFGLLVYLNVLCCNGILIESGNITGV